MVPPSRSWLRHARHAVAATLLTIFVAACGLVSTTPPPARPEDFAGIATELGRRGIRIDDVVSGDPGCADGALAPTAIRFTIQGLDQASPVPVFLYIFRNREAFERRRADVDQCASSYVTDPETFASIDASPFVLAGQGPWAPELAAALRAGLTEAAGSGN